MSVYRLTHHGVPSKCRLDRCYHWAIEEISQNEPGKGEEWKTVTTLKDGLTFGEGTVALTHAIAERKREEERTASATIS